MDNCSNCFNGCPEITSDKCVKYTGLDVPLLGIQNGDSLSYVEQALITFLSSTLNGTGIKIDIPEEIICEAVATNLPTCGDITVVDLITALIKSVCTLVSSLEVTNSLVSGLQEQLAALEANYTIHCLEDVSTNSGTHAILQATINKLCAFVTDVETNYVQQADLCDLVTACINSGDGANKAYSKMVPYTIVEYYGALSNYPDTGDSFDGTGAGQGYWEKVYLCNGLNGTPDKRGRVSVGVTDGTIGGATMSSVVNPSSSIFNPTYTKGVPVNGANSEIISTSQLPAHTHTATATSVVTDPKHKHASGQGVAGFGADSGSYEVLTNNVPPTVPEVSATDWTSEELTGITVATTVVNASTGGGQPISLVQPGIGCVYIMYIP